MPGLSREQWQSSITRDEVGQTKRASGVFVTGTGTEIGKTVVAAVLARTLVEDGKSVAVFKPALTGMDEFPDYDEAAAIAATTGDGEAAIANLPDHAILRIAARSSQTDDEIAPYRFDPPMSPHLAAGLAGVEIDPERVMAAARAAADGVEAIVCEGAGGLLVPLAPSWTVRSCAVELGYPLVVIAPPGLGTINHTLLTVESARSVGLKVAAVVINPWPEDPTQIEADNRETIAAMSGVEVLTLPKLDLSAPSTWPQLHLPG
ncbi:MAG TPA: dethiobiotin synthase [Solirubrobacterales bacterium]|jgi:dethiobiotin synthetase|nr:dethiobiotin synthase [Solirubrobacterales bacterium]